MYSYAQLYKRYWFANDNFAEEESNNGRVVSAQGRPAHVGASAPLSGSLVDW